MREKNFYWQFEQGPLYFWLSAFQLISLGFLQKYSIWSAFIRRFGLKIALTCERYFIEKTKICPWTTFGFLCEIQANQILNEHWRSLSLMNSMESNYKKEEKKGNDASNMYNNCIVFHHQLFGRCAHLDGSAMHINTVEVVSKVSFGVDLLSDCNWVFIHVKLTRTSKTFGSIESKVCEYNLKPLAHSLRHSHFGMLASVRSIIGISIIHWDAYIILPLPLPLTLSFAWHPTISIAIHIFLLNFIWIHA